MRNTLNTAAVMLLCMFSLFFIRPDLPYITAFLCAVIICCADRFFENDRGFGLFCILFFIAGIPDPDLLIRTSGELRLSNYLLWQLAYTEIYVTDCLWPDFDREELERAIVQYNKRDRRYGGVK